MTPRVRQYAAEIAAEHDVSPEAILSPCRKAPAARARNQLYRRLSRDGFNSLQIGRWLERDPSTVRAGLNRELVPFTRPKMARDASGRWTGRAE